MGKVVMRFFRFISRSRPDSLSRSDQCRRIFNFPALAACHGFPMSTTSQPNASAASSTGPGWRTPFVIIACGCLIGVLTFGPRSSAGFIMQPMSTDFAWGRDVFAFAFAIQNLLWGVGQPIAGALADRFGTPRVLMTGAILYALGLSLMVYSNTPLVLTATLGILVGFGLSGASFNLVVTAIGKLIPEHLRSTAMGAATAAGSFGQFLFAPLCVALIASYGWMTTVVVFAALVLFVVPLSLALATPKNEAASTASADSGERLGFTAALRQAFGHRSYVFLVLGFFTCGFQLAFVTAHLPAYLTDKGMPAWVGGTVMATIGLCNIVGALGAGWLGNKVPKRYILSVIYLMRAVSIFLFITIPMTPTTAMIYAAITGVTWLSTVPPTSGLVATMFGTRWLSMLFGFVFFSHQVGGFLGVWLGGLVYESTKSYDPVWYLAIALGIFSALINLPIVEKPAARMAIKPA